MKYRFLAVSCVALLFLVCFSVPTYAQETNIQVTYDISDGGLLWVNGTAIANASTVTYANGTNLVLSAVPISANFSFQSFSLNGTTYTSNPQSFNITDSEVGTFNQTVSLDFAPISLTVDDSVGLATVALVFAICLPVAFVMMLKRKEAS